MIDSHTPFSRTFQCIHEFLFTKALKCSSYLCSTARSMSFVDKIFQIYDWRSKKSCSPACHMYIEPKVWRQRSALNLVALWSPPQPFATPTVGQISTSAPRMSRYTWPDQNQAELAWNPVLLGPVLQKAKIRPNQPDWDHPLSSGVCALPLVTLRWPLFLHW
jgi:hypothetical protein